jgi:hypothetical protein
MTTITIGLKNRSNIIMKTNLFSFFCPANERKQAGTNEKEKLGRDFSKREGH